MPSHLPVVAFGQLPISNNPRVFNFSDLPTELREKIYRRCMRIPRVVSILPNATTRNHKTFTRPPVLLFICRESRYFALKLLVNIFPLSENPVYVNPQVDKVLLSTYRSPSVPNGSFQGLDLSMVKSLAILQEDMGLASGNVDAELIEASCLRPFGDLPDDVANPERHIPQPEWFIGSIRVLGILIESLLRNSGSNVEELVVLVMPPNTKKWSPTQMDMTIQKCLSPGTRSTGSCLVEKLQAMVRRRINFQRDEFQLPHYLVTTEPIATPESIQAIHGYSPALQDGLGFHHTWYRVEIHPNLKFSYFGLRLYRAPAGHGNMLTEGGHWPVAGRNCKNFIRLMPFEWETMFLHAILHNLEPPLIVDALLILKHHSKARYLSKDRKRFLDPFYLDAYSILARLYNQIDPFLQSDSD